MEITIYCKVNSHVEKWKRKVMYLLQAECELSLLLVLTVDINPKINVDYGTIMPEF